MGHRSIRLLVVGLVGLLAVAATPPGEMGSPEGVGFTSDGVEWVDTIGLHSGTAGGTLHDGRYYVTDPRGVYVYDVDDPERPELLGALSAQQIGLHTVLAKEQPDTNGEILLVDAVDPAEPSTSDRLLVVDVSDPGDMAVVGSHEATAHTWTCVRDCAFAYGRDGEVIDLSDPTDPTVATNWRDHVDDDDYLHHFTEVAHGRVIGAGQPSYYFAVDADGTPEQLARIDSDFHSLGYHGGDWPNDATDPLMLMGAEVAPAGATNLAGSDCNDDSAHAVATYDATDVRAVDERQFERGSDRGRQRGERSGHERQRADAAFHKLAEWRVDGRGAYADGGAPAHRLYCGHWFDPHPDWDAGGVLAIAHYDWGVRFLDVDADGSMDERDWWQPVGGYTGAVNWITDEVAYVHDYERGIDILRVHDADR